MTPLRFGPTSRQMLGFFHPAARTSAAAPAVLLCNPFGPEAIRSYRMQRILADRLAAAGCPTMRFDYYGTGDSPGDDEAASLAGWAGDIGVGHRELVARSGKSRIAWIGIRLGASLCMLAAQSPRQHLEHLILWDPLIDGARYLEVFRSPDAHEPDAHGVRPDAFQTMGFDFPDRFKSELRALHLASVELSGVRRTTVLTADDDADAHAFKSALTRTGAHLEWIAAPAVAEWNSEKALNSAVIPMPLLQLAESKVLEAA